MRSGLAFLVGEAGPELFVPTQTGTIVPNNQISQAAPAGPVRGGVTFGDINVQSQADPVMLADAITWRMKTAGI